VNSGSLVEESVGALPRRERERRQRRRDILDAAEAVFAAKGFHAASIEQIARKAEYATGTVYLYFQDKEALYIELLGEKIRELLETIRRHVADVSDPVEALKILVRVRMDYFGRHRAFFRIYAREGMNRYEQRRDRWTGVTRTYEEYLDLLARLIQSAQRRGRFRKGEPRLYAVALSGMMIQLTLDWLQSPEEHAPADRTEFVLDLFLQGAQAD